MGHVSILLGVKSQRKISGAATHNRVAVYKSEFWVSIYRSVHPKLRYSIAARGASEQIGEIGADWARRL
jgi:hypothetical protein